MVSADRWKYEYPGGSKGSCDFPKDAERPIVRRRVGMVLHEPGVGADCAEHEDAEHKHPSVEELRLAYSRTTTSARYLVHVTGRNVVCSM
eukprot:SAG22_NODE_588_length_8842_cov_33.853254_8_plen_90_part_00